MNWNNIKEDKCPKCNKKLQFRLEGRPFKIKANKGFSKTREKGNLYFCSACDGFQITEKRLLELKNKQIEDIKNSIPKENKHLFKTGLLRF